VKTKEFTMMGKTMTTTTNNNNWGGARPGAGRPRTGRKINYSMYIDANIARRLDALSGGKRKGETAAEMTNEAVMRRLPNWLIGQMIVLLFPEGSKMRIANKSASGARANRRADGYKKTSTDEENRFYSNALVLFPPGFVKEAADAGIDRFIRLSNLQEWREKFAEHMLANGWDPATITPSVALRKGEEQKAKTIKKF
jgi:hypothetical protein